MFRGVQEKESQNNEDSSDDYSEISNEELKDLVKKLKFEKM
jgi:hypothetical protein